VPTSILPNICLSFKSDKETAKGHLWEKEIVREIQGHSLLNSLVMVRQKRGGERKKLILVSKAYPIQENSSRRKEGQLVFEMARIIPAKSSFLRVA
jgi:hypothetical protein